MPPAQITQSPPSLAFSRSLPKSAIHSAAMTTANRSEEHTSELQSLMRISYAVFCLKKKNSTNDGFLAVAADHTGSPPSTTRPRSHHPRTEAHTDILPKLKQISNTH